MNHFLHETRSDCTRVQFAFNMCDSDVLKSVQISHSFGINVKREELRASKAFCIHKTIINQSVATAFRSDILNCCAFSFSPDALLFRSLLLFGKVCAIVQFWKTEAP